MSVLLGIRMLSLLRKMCLLHVWRDTDLAHVLVSHGRELCRVHIHVHAHSVASHIAITHLLGLGHKLTLLKHPLLLNGEHVRIVHSELLLLLEHLWIEMVHSVSIRAGARRHAATHQRGGIDLAAGSGYAHMSGGHLLRHTGLRAGLAGIMRHTRSHGMTRRDSRVLLHSNVETAWHGLHRV